MLLVLLVSKKLNPKLTTAVYAKYIGYRRLSLTRNISIPYLLEKTKR